jgi:hypothetical protein
VSLGGDTLRGPNEPFVSDSLETNGMHHGEEVVQDVVPTPATPAQPAPQQAAAEAAPAFLVFLRVADGERVQAGGFATEQEAHRHAEQMMAAAAAATTMSKWPRIGDRYFRPETIISIDVEASDAPRWVGSTARTSSWTPNS